MRGARSVNMERADLARFAIYQAENGALVSASTSNRSTGLAPYKSFVTFDGRSTSAERDGNAAAHCLAQTMANKRSSFESAAERAMQLGFAANALKPIDSVGRATVLTDWAIRTNDGLVKNAGHDVSP